MPIIALVAAITLIGAVIAVKKGRVRGKPTHNYRGMFLFLPVGAALWAATGNPGFLGLMVFGVLSLKRPNQGSRAPEDSVHLGKDAIDHRWNDACDVLDDPDDEPGIV